MLKRLWLLVWVGWAVLVIGMVKSNELAAGEHLNGYDSAAVLLIAFAPFLVGRVLRLIVLGPLPERRSSGRGNS